MSDIVVVDNPEIVTNESRQLSIAGAMALPAIVERAGWKAADRFIQYFTAEIENDNTRLAYARAVADFLSWADERGLELHAIKPVEIAAYVKTLKEHLSDPSVKQRLSAITKLFDYLLVGGSVEGLETNPAAAVKGPKHVVKSGKTPVLEADQARHLLDSITTDTVVGLRDRALIAVMVYSFARVSAVVGMNVMDYYPDGKRYWIRLHEKGGKHHEVPAHHNVEEYLDAYIAAAGIRDELKGPLFRSAIRKTKQLNDRAMSRTDVLRMIKRRAKGAGLPPNITCHTFRATGITAYLNNGGTVEKAQQIAAHESPRTTKLYDRTHDPITLDEINRIAI